MVTGGAVSAHSYALSALYPGRVVLPHAGRGGGWSVGGVTAEKSGEGGGGRRKVYCRGTLMIYIVSRARLLVESWGPGRR